MPKPVLIIHGGAGNREGRHARFSDYASHLTAIVAAGEQILLRQGAQAAVHDAIQKLEDDPIFNAGTGSRVQHDGIIRMTAALMDSQLRSLSGVINIERVQHPIAVASLLRGQKHSVLAAQQATAFARQHGFVDYDPLTEFRYQEYLAASSGRTGTVGAVAVDEQGILCAGTSTGGVGNETAGRVSDSGTVAGTYASAHLGVSCTGVGEQIVNHAAAARVVVRVEDGMPLADAVNKTMQEAEALDYHYGLIALARNGSWAAPQTSSVTTLYAVSSAGVITTFLDQ